MGVFFYKNWSIFLNKYPKEICFAGSKINITQFIRIEKLKGKDRSEGQQSKFFENYVQGERY
jgi:hypothetical protein